MHWRKKSAVELLSEPNWAAPELFTKDVFCKEFDILQPEDIAVSEARLTIPKRRKVKSDAVDQHERTEDYLDKGEVELLLAAAKAGRHGARDYLLLLMFYRHALRVSEAVGLRLDQVNLREARVWVRRSKNSLDT